MCACVRVCLSVCVCASSTPNASAFIMLQVFAKKPAAKLFERLFLTTFGVYRNECVLQLLPGLATARTPPASRQWLRGK